MNSFSRQVICSGLFSPILPSSQSVTLHAVGSGQGAHRLKWNYLSHFQSNGYTGWDCLSQVCCRCRWGAVRETIRKNQQGAVQAMAKWVVGEGGPSVAMQIAWHQSSAQSCEWDSNMWRFVRASAWPKMVFNAKKMLNHGVGLTPWRSGRKKWW